MVLYIIFFDEKKIGLLKKIYSRPIETFLSVQNFCYSKTHENFISAIFQYIPLYTYCCTPHDAFTA